MKHVEINVCHASELYPALSAVITPLYTQMIIKSCITSLIKYHEKR